MSGVSDERRTATHAGPSPNRSLPFPPPESNGRKKLILVGWDAADWKVINPLVDAGLMPTLERLIEKGVMGNLATLDPPLSPMLWTSIATGKTADQHGVLGFVEPTPDGSGIRPCSVTSRKAKAIWNILNQQGYRCHVVGWWPSHPAEPINGVAVSNLFNHASRPAGKSWPMPRGSVHPNVLHETIAALRVHPQELTAEHILPFVPRAAEIDQEQDRSLAMIAKIIADASSVQSVATWILRTQPWDVMAVYFDAIDHFSHGFMKFHPPRRKEIPSKLFEFYQGVVASGYRFHDMLLEYMLANCDENTYVILVSDHGFHPDHLRPAAIPREPAGPAVEHREHGVICIHGPGVKQDELVFGASVLDVAPTMLMLLGEAIGRDMRGKALFESMAVEPTLEFVDSWEDIDGDSGMHDKSVRRDPWAEAEALQQLVALGYLEAPDKDVASRVEKVRRESRFYLARSLVHQRLQQEAVPILKELWAEAPDQLRYGLYLAGCYRDLGQYSKLRSILEALSVEFDRQRSDSEPRQGELPPETMETGNNRSDRRNQRAAPRSNTVRPWYPPLELVWGQLLLAEKDPKGALMHLQRAESAIRRSPDLHISIGNVYLQQQEWDDAARAFGAALQIDNDSAAAHHGLAIAHLRRRRFRQAANAALSAVSLRYRYPMAHYHLGEAMAALGDLERAAEALEVCVAQSPGALPARRGLVKLYDRLNSPDRSASHREFLERIAEEADDRAKRPDQ